MANKESVRRRLEEPTNESITLIYVYKGLGILRSIIY